MEVFELPDDVLTKIVGFFDVEVELVSLLRTCKRLREVASDEQHWESWCEKKFGLRSSTAPSEPGSSLIKQCQTWKECVQRWHAVSKHLQLGRVNAALYIRTCLVWEVYLSV